MTRMEEQTGWLCGSGGNLERPGRARRGGAPSTPRFPPRPDPEVNPFGAPRSRACLDRCAPLAAPNPGRRGLGRQECGGMAEARGLVPGSVSRRPPSPTRTLALGLGRARPPARPHACPRALPTAARTLSRRRLGRRYLRAVEGHGGPFQWDSARRLTPHAASPAAAILSPAHTHSPRLSRLRIGLRAAGRERPGAYAPCACAADSLLRPAASRKGKGQKGEDGSAEALDEIRAAPSLGAYIGGRGGTQGLSDLEPRPEDARVSLPRPASPK
ncbi:PREDICTED: proline-rich protein 18-like [Chrysochloris asiatica]|uniref:Proline-rich protein 18-like n=1 Tax=Chrysochloris asiatica TaxID=185453 RepID=A0A9B0T8B2_CHRAS|nr:PREDICTED: proline-rich protein 18-like [Chrysochloris asiatica]